MSLGWTEAGAGLGHLPRRPVGLVCNWLGLARLIWVGAGLERVLETITRRAEIVVLDISKFHFLTFFVLSLFSAT